MIKKIVIMLIAVGCMPCILAAVSFQMGTLPLVDGIYNSTQAVITGRQPVFSWEYSGVVSSFTVTVSSDPATFLSSGETWNYYGSTSAANTINFITRIPYNVDGAASDLSVNQTYFWQVIIYGEGVSALAAGQFSTVSSAIVLSVEKYDLAVDWNNPFNPSKNQYTLFRFTAKDRDRKMKLRIFTVSGELVRQWNEVTVLKDAWLTQDWDGKNDTGQIVARGIYFVNLIDVGDNTGITRRAAVIK